MGRDIRRLMIGNVPDDDGRPRFVVCVAMVKGKLRVYSRRQFVTGRAGLAWGTSQELKAIKRLGAECAFSLCLRAVKRPSDAQVLAILDAAMKSPALTRQAERHLRAGAWSEATRTAVVAAAVDTCSSANPSRTTVLGQSRLGADAQSRSVEVPPQNENAPLGESGRGVPVA